MRRTALRILEHLTTESATVTELADALDKNQGWVSELVADLEDRNLVTTDGAVAISDTYEAQLVRQLVEKYDVEAVLSGSKEDLLEALLDDPKTVSDLELDGFAQSTVYQHLNDLRAVGIVDETSEGYVIADDTVAAFLEAQTTTAGEAYTANGARIRRVTSGGDVDGTLTAFSAFTRYGVEYYPADDYVYQGDADLDLEAVLIHAVTFADTPRQLGIAGVFYLTHSGSLDNQRLWTLARTWGCVETWADLLAFLDRRPVHRETAFPSWSEFTTLANEYGVYPREKHPEDSLLTGFESIGESVSDPVDAYLLGGGNLILRGLKDSTKDIDLVVDGRDEFAVLVDTLQGMGFTERTDFEGAYEGLDPSVIMEKDGFPNWDIFVGEVAGKLRLSESMKRRVDERRVFGDVTLHLLSLTDIFLFKSVTERDGDLEDASLIARQGRVDWEALFDEVQTQEDITGQLFSFHVMDTLDIIEQRDGIEAPIHQRVVSYCLENALQLSLTEPKTIRDLRAELDFPDHQIYNKLRKLEDQGVIDVDRTGKLNEYRVVD